MLGMLIISVYVLDYVRVLKHKYYMEKVVNKLTFQVRDSPHTFNTTCRQV